jgi:hypothetical protein
MFLRFGHIRSDERQSLMHLKKKKCMSNDAVEVEKFVD